jgi:hypothetical protein
VELFEQIRREFSQGTQRVALCQQLDKLQTDFLVISTQRALLSTRQLALIQEKLGTLKTTHLRRPAFFSPLASRRALIGGRRREVRRALMSTPNS